MPIYYSTAHTPTTAHVQFAHTRLEQSLSSDGHFRVIGAHSVPNDTEKLEREFHSLAKQWRAETRHMSIAADKVAHFALHQIIGMGEQALPLILRDLQSKPTDWFWALRAIARERAPEIPEEDKGVVRRIANIWIQWGKANGYLERT